MSDPKVTKAYLVEILAPVLVEQFVEGVDFGCGAGVGAGSVDVALRGDHGFVDKELHQRIDADVGVGEFGGERVPQAVYQCTHGSFAVQTCFLEGAKDPVLQVFPA